MGGAAGCSSNRYKRRSFLYLVFLVFKRCYLFCSRPKASSLFARSMCLWTQKSFQKLLIVLLHRRRMCSKSHWKKLCIKKSLIDSLYKVVRTNLDTDTHCISFYSIFSRSKTELWINSAQWHDPEYQHCGQLCGGIVGGFAAASS